MYLYVDSDGDSWERLDGARFWRMRHDDAMKLVFDSWWVLNRATAKERNALKKAPMPGNAATAKTEPARRSARAHRPARFGSCRASTSEAERGLNPFRC